MIKRILFLFFMLLPACANLAVKHDQEAKPELPKSPELTDFVLVKGGCFEMGDMFGEGWKDEKPVHKVCLDDFYMDKHPVTQKQWTQVMGNNPSYFKNCDECPVENVTWNDVQKFINTLNKKTGILYRLPTEAEWEYAARSGGKKDRWAGISEESELGKYAWYDVNSNSKTHQVRQLKPNDLGLYDMTGNVWELTNDWYGEDYYKNSDRDNPRGPLSGKYHVIRGGSWVNTSWYIRASKRLWVKPTSWHPYIGFRLVVSALSAPFLNN